MSSEKIDSNKNLENNNDPSKKRHKLSQIEKSIIKLNYLSNLKIRKKYNCTKKTYEKCIITILLNNANCHLVSIFKEKMLTDFIDEFLRRKYSRQEGIERIPKFAVYYKNYLQFFCKPTFTDFVINEIINDYGEKKAELYYKNNYQGGKSKDNEDLGFEESNSDEESDKNRFKVGANGEIFDESIKDNIDNVTIMTTINNSKNNSINLNLNNEKIEVFSENKCDKSNDTTLHELMDIVKKGEKNMYKIKEKNNEKKKDNNNNNNTTENNDLNYNNDTNSNKNKLNNNFNKSKKSHKSKKKKSDALNIVDYKHVLLNRGVVVHSQSKKKDNNKIPKKKIDKNNLELNLFKAGGKILSKLSFEKLQHILKKGGNTVKNKNTNIKYPLNNYINNIINEKNDISEKDNKIVNQVKKENKDPFNKKRTNKKINNHSANINSKTKSLSKEKEKESEKKGMKNANKNNNRFYSIKNSYGSINQFNKSNNLNFNIGQRTNKNYSRSRNNTGFLYKQSNTNNIINNNIMFNLNNIYNTTSLHKMNKNMINNIHNNAYFGKTNAFKTLNFMQKTNYHQRYNNNLLQLHNDNNKFHISNTSQDNKSSSLKVLVTDFNNINNNNNNIVKPTIKLQKEKYLIKSKYTNNRENNIYELNNNKNHRITKSYNNLNMNNIHLSNNGITSYNNLKNKYKKFSNSKTNHQLKNIKQNQIKSNSSSKHKKNETNNKELMQFALSLLLDNNSTFSNVVENNGLNLHHNNNNNNNLIARKNNNNKNNNKTNSTKKNKINYNFKNKYHNNNTNYNININNQININTNSGKDYLNTKLKNQELNNNHHRDIINQKDIMYNNFLNANSNMHNSGAGNSHNNNSENINLNKKMKGKNILMGLKKGYLNINKNTKNENIIKSYHTKSVSSLTDIITNKKLGNLNKNISKSKSKERKKK